jgi:hypothetical protein
MGQNCACGGAEAWPIQQVAGVSVWSWDQGSDQGSDWGLPESRLIWGLRLSLGLGFGWDQSLVWN